MSLIRKDLLFLTTNTLKVKKKKIHINITFTQTGNQRTAVKPEPGAKDQGHRQDGWSAVALDVL